MHFKLLVVMVEDRHTNEILAAARAEGATGATVLNQARGEGLSPTKTFLGEEAQVSLLGIGRQLVLKLIEDARSLGYSKMRLDTLPSMQRAQELYRAMGFKPIGPYRPNPVPGALFFELDIS